MSSKSEVIKELATCGRLKEIESQFGTKHLAKVREYVSEQNIAKCFTNLISK